MIQPHTAVLFHLLITGQRSVFNSLFLFLPHGWVAGRGKLSPLVLLSILLLRVAWPLFQLSGLCSYLPGIPSQLWAVETGVGGPQGACPLTTLVTQRPALMATEADCMEGGNSPPRTLDLSHIFQVNCLQYTEKLRSVLVQQLIKWYFVTNLTTNRWVWTWNWTPEQKSNERESLCHKTAIHNFYQLLMRAGKSLTSIPTLKFCESMNY